MNKRNLKVDKIYIMSKDIFLLPIQKRDHWSLVGVTIHYFDSKGSRSTTKAHGVIKTYLENVAKTGEKLRPLKSREVKMCHYKPMEWTVVCLSVNMQRYLREKLR